MTQIIDTSYKYAAKWFHDKGYSVNIREEEDTIEIKNGKNVVAEFVCFSGPSICYFVTADEAETQCCSLEKNSMIITSEAAAMMLKKGLEGEIFFSIGV